MSEQTSGVLVKQVVTFPNKEPSIVTIPFDIPCNVTAGVTYAICIRSPLSHYSHAPTIGGWSSSCFNGKENLKYYDGNAFVSYNNSYNWELYGMEDNTVSYHQGNQAPFNFAFETQIAVFSKEELDL